MLNPWKHVEESAADSAGGPGLIGTQRSIRPLESDCMIENDHQRRKRLPPARVYTGIVGRTSTNERWQAEDCGRQMTDKHPKRPRDNTTPPLKKPR
jgi:hypothetical protein